MRYIVEIDTETEEFRQAFGYEVECAIRYLLGHLRNCGTADIKREVIPLFDSKGNRVGTARFEE